MNAYLDLPNGTSISIAIFVETPHPEIAEYDWHEVESVTLLDGTEVHDIDGVDFHTRGYEFLIEQEARRAVRDDVDPGECWQDYQERQREWDNELWSYTDD